MLKIIKGDFFFGKNADIKQNIIDLKKEKKFKFFQEDINNTKALEKIFKRYKIVLTIHAAAQPSHDWSASQPLIDYKVNALGTLNLLNIIKKFRPHSQFIFLSTNKVYGDIVNNLNYFEKKSRYEIENKFKNGFDENVPIDNSMHSPFGASKLSADILCQEFGKYFGIKTCSLRAWLSYRR